MDTLNDRYKAIELIRQDDNVNYAIYFDQQGNFGAVHYNQDDGDVFTKYLEPMLKANAAKRTLSAVLASAMSESAVHFSDESSLETWCEKL